MKPHCNIYNITICSCDSYNFCPLTFNLPGEYSLFFEEFKKQSNALWIMKPVNYILFVFLIKLDRSFLG